MISFRDRHVTQGDHEPAPHRIARTADTFSFIRTVTVGSGLAPDLLTPPMEGARGLAAEAAHRRWRVSPRPENVATLAASSKSEQAVRIEFEQMHV